jgi:predicted DNA-binding transcriptional regulator YafY
MGDRENLTLIIQAMRERKILSFTYTDKKGKTETRRGEPYEIKNGSLFVFDHARQQIRQFFLGRIQNPAIEQTTFEPRWPVRDQIEI